MGAGRNSHTSLIAADDPHSRAAEAFRTLRTNLQFASVAGLEAPSGGKPEGAQVLLVTSSVPEEGKSTVTANLGVTFASADVRTLLIDGDLRRPCLHEILGLPSTVGLTSLLLGHATLDGAVQPTEVTGLDLLASGPIPPNPAELLGCRAMRDLMGELRRRYGAILIDSPPVVSVTDASVLAPVADGVVLVVTTGKTTRDAARLAREQLRRVKARLLGVVMNRVPGRDRYDHYYDYYYTAKRSGMDPAPRLNGHHPSTPVDAGRSPRP